MLYSVQLSGGRSVLYRTYNVARETLIKSRSFNVFSLLRALDQDTECMEAYYKICFLNFSVDASNLTLTRSELSAGYD